MSFGFTSRDSPRSSTFVGNMYLISISMLVNLFTAGFPTVSSAPVLLARESVVSNTSATINATILDHAGHDITSSFQIRVYYPEKVLPSITNHSLSNRQASHHRGLFTCSDGGIFFESFCTPEDNEPGSLKSYTIICHHLVLATNTWGFPDMLLGEYEPIGYIPNQTIEPRPRGGHCADNEICVDGLGARKSTSGRRMASCVSTDSFIKLIKWGDNDERTLSLEGRKASMVASGLDESTPLEVDTFEVDTETTASSNNQNSKCRDCVRLETDEFEATTEGLKVQTTLLTTGAVAGVLWLAIMSG